MLIRRIFLMILLAAALPEGMRGAEVALKEVSLTLFNKPVTGYRLVVDRTQALISEEIIRHVSKSGGYVPFHFEQTIIFENIIYTPVDTRREISLYYLLRPLEENYTELTVVAMYDYRRSISSREFPDLFQNLLTDIAALVKSMSGDTLRYGDNLVSEKQPVHTASSQPVKTVETMPDEEVDNKQLVIHTNPFKADTVVKKQSEEDKIYAQRTADLNRRESELAAKEKNWTEQETQYRRREKKLQDSIVYLTNRLTGGLRAQYSGDETSISTDAEEKFLILREQLSREAAERAALFAKVDSLQAKCDTLSKDLGSAESRHSDLAHRYAKLQDEFFDLQASINRNTAATTDVSEMQAENDSLRRVIYTLRTAASETKPITAPAENTAQITQLRDSIRLLEARITTIGLAQGEMLQLTQKMDDLNASLLQANQKLRQSEEVKTNQAEDITKLTARNRELETSLQSSSASLKTTQAKLQEKQTLLEGAEVRLQSLQKDLNSASALVKSRESQALLLRDSLNSERIKTAALKKSLSSRNTDAQRLEKIADSLRVLVYEHDRDAASWNQEKLLLQARIDSLKLHAAPVTEQQKFIKEQWTKLEEWEARLNGRDRDAADRDKLLAQRETYIKQREPLVKTLEERTVQLQERENRIRVREDQLGIPSPEKYIPPKDPAPVLITPASAPTITTEKIAELGRYVPVYRLPVTGSYKEAQLRAAGYMVSKGFLYKEIFPDLYYDEAQIAQLGTVAVRIRTEASGSSSVLKVSFRLKSGDYIEPESFPELHNRAIQFLEELAAFK